MAVCPDTKLKQEEKKTEQSILALMKEDFGNFMVGIHG